MRTNGIQTIVTSALPGLTGRMDGQLSTPGSWFDGFWDYFVRNRDRISTGPAWEIQGVSGPWAVLIIAPSEGAAVLEVAVFVEAKDRRLGVRAPWAVSSVVLGGTDDATQAPPDAGDRAHDVTLTDQLRALGFAVHFGYWGLRAMYILDRVVPNPVARVQKLMKILPYAVLIARDAAESVSS